MWFRAGWVLSSPRGWLDWEIQFLMVLDIGMGWNSGQWDVRGSLPEVWEQTKPNTSKMEDWKDKKCKYPSELSNFLPLYFLLHVISLVCSEKQILGQRANMPLGGCSIREHMWGTERGKEGRRESEYEKALSSWVPLKVTVLKEPCKLQSRSVHVGSWGGGILYPPTLFSFSQVCLESLKFLGFACQGTSSCPTVSSSLALTGNLGKMRNVWSRFRDELRYRPHLILTESQWWIGIRLKGV